MSQILNSIITLGLTFIGFSIGWGISKLVIKRRRTPRMLVANEAIPLADYRNEAPSGLAHVIQGSRVREGDVIFLTNQADASLNGFWKVNSSFWQRVRTPNEVTLRLKDGVWVLDTGTKKKKQSKIKRVSRYQRKWVI